jgi:hypothetical protein
MFANDANNDVQIRVGPIRHAAAPASVAPQAKLLKIRPIETGLPVLRLKIGF